MIYRILIAIIHNHVFSFQIIYYIAYVQWLGRRDHDSADADTNLIRIKNMKFHEMINWILLMTSIDNRNHIECVDRPRKMQQFVASAILIVILLVMNGFVYSINLLKPKRFYSIVHIFTASNGGWISLLCLVVGVVINRFVAWLQEIECETRSLASTAVSLCCKENKIFTSSSIVFNCITDGIINFQINKFEWFTIHCKVRIYKLNDKLTTKCTEEKKQPKPEPRCQIEPLNGIIHR